MDESWIGEQAWFFSHDGYVRTDLFAGYESSDVRILVYHRLLVWVGAGATEFLGFGLPQLRLVSLLCAAALLVIMASCRESSRVTNRFGPPSVLLSMFLFFRFAGYYRPEAMLALFAWLQWCLILQAAKKGSRLLALTAGIACGLGILTHLNGAAFAAGSAAVLLSAGRPRLLVPFALATLLVGFGPLAEAARYPSLFWSQFTGELVRTKTSLSPLAPLWNLVREHQRLFREPGMILITLATASAALLGGSGRHRTNPLFYPFALASLLALATLTGSKSAKYAIPLLPFAASEIWAGLEMAFSPAGRRAGWRRWPVVALTLALICHGGVSAALLTASPAEDLAGTNRQAGLCIPDGSSCVAPMGFIFDEIGRITIHGLYLAESREDGALTPAGLLAFARERDAGFAVLDSATAANLGPLPEGTFTQLRQQMPQVYRLRVEDGLKSED